jgi:hypothetical protein
MGPCTLAVPRPRDPISAIPTIAAKRPIATIPIDSISLVPIALNPIAFNPIALGRSFRTDVVDFFSLELRLIVR